MIHVYAVIDDPDVAVGVAGIEAAPVEVLTAVDVGIAVSRHARSDLAPSTEAILAHAHVCDALLRATKAVLPVRFGARYGSDEDLQAAISERHAEFSDALRRVRRRVEIGVRIVAAESDGYGEDDEPGLSEATTGTGYLERRLAEERRRTRRRAVAERLADDVAAHASDHAVDCRINFGVDGAAAASMAFLVEESAVSEFTNTVAGWAESHPEVQVVCTGPWPPYHFSGEGGLT